MITATLARDMMTKKLVTLSSRLDVFEAIDILLQKRISGAPVIDANGNFCGIFSESSCMRVVVNAAYDSLPDTNLMPFVDPHPPTISPDTDMLTICQTFLDQATRRLPVIENGRLLGQISRRDIMRHMRDASQQRIPHRPETLYLSALSDDAWIGS